MTNSEITAEMLFLYTPRETIPQGQINRFLQLCDEQIKELNIEDLTSADIDEVAQFNRTRMFKDFILKTMANPPKVKDQEGNEQEVEQFSDLSFITQLEKLHKQMDKHIENLKVRRKDRHTGKIGGQKRSIADMARELDEEPDRLDDLSNRNKSELEKYESEFPDSDPLKFINDMSSPEDE